MKYSCITTLAIYVYIEKGVVLADISNPNTSISKIINYIRPVTKDQKSKFQIAKMTKMNIVKHSRN